MTYATLLFAGMLIADNSLELGKGTLDSLCGEVLLTQTNDAEADLQYTFFCTTKPGDDARTVGVLVDVWSRYQSGTLAEQVSTYAMYVDSSGQVLSCHRTDVDNHRCQEKEGTVLYAQWRRSLEPAAR